jgi:cytochrome c551/c552
MKLASVSRKGCVSLALLCAAVLLAACDNKDEKSAAKATVDGVPAVVAVSPSGAIKDKGLEASAPMVDESIMPQLARKNNCAACHSIGKKIVGPAWLDVATRYKGATKFEYKGKEYPLLEGLMMKVSLGGSGHWGVMPMPANDYAGIKQAEIKELVQFILGLAK